MANPKPIKEIPLGNIRAAIWANQSKDQRTWFSVTIARSYRSGEQSKDSTSFSRDELPVVALAATMAYSWIWEQQVVVSDTEDAV